MHHNLRRAEREFRHGRGSRRVLKAGTVIRMAGPVDRDYWNHNTAYHPWLVAIAAEHRGDVLDVGCSDGLLAQRLARVSRSVTGIDPDPAAIEPAADRLALYYRCLLRWRR